MFQSINIVTAMCEMAGPRFKHDLILALEQNEDDEEEEPDLVFNKKMAPATTTSQLLYSPPASSSEEGYASATISPSGENANNEEEVKK